MSPVPGPLRAVARVARRRAEQLYLERRYRLIVAPEDVGPFAQRTHQHRNAYAPSPWGMLTRILPVAETDAADVLADFGCGRGRVLLEAAERYRFARVLGIEADPQLAQSARSLMSANEHLYPGQSWEVVTADVLDYAVPDDVTVAYLFDPFTGPLFDAVISLLEASLERRPRRLRIVYLVPGEIDRFERSGRVAAVRRGSAGWLRTGGRYDYFVGELTHTTH